MTETQNRPEAGTSGAADCSAVAEKQLSSYSQPARRGHARPRSPYLFLIRTRYWTRHFGWTLNLRIEAGKPGELLHYSESQSEIFNQTLAYSRRLRVPLLGRWLPAYQRFHRANTKPRRTKS